MALGMVQLPNRCGAFRGLNVRHQFFGEVWARRLVFLVNLVNIFGLWFVDASLCCDLWFHMCDSHTRVSMDPGCYMMFNELAILGQVILAQGSSEQHFSLAHSR